MLTTYMIKRNLAYAMRCLYAHVGNAPAEWLDKNIATFKIIAMF